MEASNSARQRPPSGLISLWGSKSQPPPKTACSLWPQKESNEHGLGSEFCQREEGLSSIQCQAEPGHKAAPVPNLRAEGRYRGDGVPSSTSQRVKLRPREGSGLPKATGQGGENPE